MARTVVITGATAGIGLASALKYAQKGFNVVVIARDQARIDQVVARIKSTGAFAVGIAADVADTHDMQRAAAQIKDRFGHVDVWVNNAMATVLAPVQHVTDEEWRRVTDVTYHGQVNGTRAALSLMAKRDRGTIVQISSALAYRPIPLQAAYAAAKAAGVAFTDALRSELLHRKSRIRLSTVYLPAVNTPQFDGWARNKMGWQQTAPATFHDPRLCAHAIYRAGTRPVRDIYVGRSTPFIKFMQVLFPSLADRQASGAWDGQLSERRQAYREGNLFDPVKGAACVHGPYGMKTSRRVRGYSTGRAHTAWIAGGAAVLILAAIKGMTRR